MVGRLPGDYNIVLSVHHPDVDRKAKKALLHSLLLILIGTHTTTIITIITTLYYYNYYISYSSINCCYNYGGNYLYHYILDRVWTYK